MSQDRNQRRELAKQNRSSTIMQDLFLNGRHNRLTLDLNTHEWYNPDDIRALTIRTTIPDLHVPEEN